MAFEKISYVNGMKELPDKPFLDEMRKFIRNGEMDELELYYLTSHIDIMAKAGEPFALFGNPDAAMVIHGKTDDWVSFGKLAKFLVQIMAGSLESITDPEIRKMIQTILDNYQEYGVVGMSEEQILPPGKDTAGDNLAGDTVYAVSNTDGKVHSYKVADAIGSVLELERIGCPGDTVYVSREKAFGTKEAADAEKERMYGKQLSESLAGIQTVEDLAAFLYQYAKPYLCGRGLFGELEAADVKAVEFGVERWKFQ